MVDPRQAIGPVASGGPLDGEQLVRISGGLADQFALLYEATPADPRAQMAGNMLTFAFAGGLSTSDEKHLEAGHEAELKAFRERFLESVSEQLKSTVAALSGGHVTFFSGVFDPGSRMTNMLFVLDLLPDDKAEQRQAIRSWSEQVKRNARALRVSNLQTRETHVALREAMERTRRRLGEKGSEDA